MKPLSAILTGTFLFCLSSFVVRAQSTFDPDAYMLFLEQNKSLTCSQLLEENTPKTTYYSGRINPANFVDVPWYDSINLVFNLTKAENNLLADNFFMVSQRLKYYGWADAFINIYSNDLPLFISTDFVLSTLHNSYDAVLQTLEWQFLEPNLMELLTAMYNTYPALYNKYSGDARLIDALKDVDLYVSVPLSLLEGKDYLPQSQDADKYNEVMQAIEDEQMKEITLFTESRMRKIDFSQFKPRGHYNTVFWTDEGQRTLEAYFRAMMWLGRIDFLLTAPPKNPWEPDWTDDELRRMQLGAVLLNELLYTCGKMDLLEKHEEIITYLVGPDDNMTPIELKGLTDQLLKAPVELFDQEKFDTFMAALNASDDYGQKIMSNFFYVDPDTSDPGQLPVSYKVLGQKFLIDSYIFSEVVYDRIVYEGEKIHRDLPDPLDAMGVLGNVDAMALMKDEMEEYKYAYKISSLKYMVDAYDESFWEQSLYNSWLAAIRDLNPPGSDKDLPYFMKTTAWHHEKLNTQLTSWAQLRHDNILYGKQSYTGGTGCSYPYTYIEPYPEFYQRLRDFSLAAKDFFEGVFEGYEFSSKSRIISYYSRYAEIMGNFRIIAEKELLGEPVNDAEITFLKTMINSFMASGPSITGWYMDLFFDQYKAMNWDYTVADVHTQPTDRFGNVVGKVLHVGNGFINMGIFLAPNPVNAEQLMAYAGPVSSFHTDTTWFFERLTDQDWEKKFLWGGEPPARPDWVAEYMAGTTGEALPEGRKLAGVLYSGTGINPPDVGRDLDYLVVFPNPATGVVHLRFILNKESIVDIGVYDASGRLIYQPGAERLLPAEHDISIDVSGLKKGLYFVRMIAGNRVFTKELIVM